MIQNACEQFLRRFKNRWTVVDSHTLGESTRLILEGCGDIPGADMREKLRYFQDNLDHVRCLLTREPRGCDLLAAAVTEPVGKGSSFGLIYMDARRYPFLCGHATIGAVTTLVELGLIPVQEHIIVDTPSGPLDTRVRMDGDKVASVTFKAVPSFVYEMDASLDVPGLGVLQVETVCVGGFFVMVDADKNGLDLSPENRIALIPLGMHIIDEANKQLTVRHPERPEVTTVDVVEFYRLKPDGSGQSVVVYGESHMDRSPCGTGTTAKITLMRRKGAVEPGQIFYNAGPLETRFAARVVEDTRVGDIPAACVEIEGSACVTGCNTFILDPTDPFQQGFML